MFADTAKVSLKAGKGGDGAVSFRHEIYVPKGGPDGGDGGRGGHVIFRADKDTNTLVDFRFMPILTAENGKNGAGQRAAGRSGRDLVLEVPIGTVIYKLVPNKILLADLAEDGAEAIIARGGAGGFGNAHFKSSTRQTPVVAEVGEPGEEFEALLELKSVADVGLVGLPNAGKSTFLLVVSNARPEIADYPFTTLTPNLGVATIDGQDLLIADIPGLIEGAAAGKGLGHDFLRHVERTAVLLHLVDVYNNDAGGAYRTIRGELERYGDAASGAGEPANSAVGLGISASESSVARSDAGVRTNLAERPEVVALTKCEGVDEEIIDMQRAAILAVNPKAQVFAISASAHQGIEKLLRVLKDAINTQKSQKIAQNQQKMPENWQNQPENELNLGKNGKNQSRNQPNSATMSQNLTNLAQNVTDFDTSNLPTISLSPEVLKNTWQVEKLEDGRYRVTGEKIEKFARRTDLNNYASVNRLRDIMKKLGIRAELTTQGAEPTSLIEIAGKEFTLVEQ